MVQEIVDVKRREEKLENCSSGFALIATVSFLLLLSLLAVGLLSLSSVEVRAAGVAEEQQRARANARLALTLAIGELQVFLGPDQRVSAPSSVLEHERTVAEPHWVGVWSTRREDGSSFWGRDDENGGLRDRRLEDGWNAETSALTYLVSGNEGGREQAQLFRDPVRAQEKDDSWVTLVSGGSLGEGADLARDGVLVPKVQVETAGNLGSYGFWVGDLGVRANVGTANAWASQDVQASQASDVFPLMTSQEVDASVMKSSPQQDELEPFDDELRSRLVSDETLSLVGGDAWRGELWHEMTIWSQGVLADVRDGGLRKDLTVFLNEPVSEDSEGLVGPLTDRDNLAGPRNPTHAQVIGEVWDDGRYQSTSPTFGMLRDWAQRSPQLGAGAQSQRSPETEFLDSTSAGSRSAFANDEAVKLAGRTRSDLKPIMVEGSMYSSISYHPNPEGFRKRYNIRRHFWPRAVLWNPYDVDIETPESVMMLQLNSRNDFVTRIAFGSSGSFTRDIQWISWGGGTRTPPPQAGELITESANYNDPYAGMFFFSLPSQVIPAGECFVYTAENAQEYNPNDVLTNRLSAEVAPDPSRNFYVSSTEFDEDDTGSGFDFRILNYRYNPAIFWVNGQFLKNQADDSRMLWKDTTGHESLSILDFDALPQLQSVSCSLQYGAGKEPALTIVSDLNNPIEVEETDLVEPLSTIKPNVRSREGFRLRWFEETLANTGEGAEGEGSYDNFAGQELFQSALIANWNLRSTFALRSPWDNVTGEVGDGELSGPWFFGAYTRDFYDSLVGWDEQLPFLEDGYYRGNPFGPPQEGRLKTILFEVPREDVGVLSLAQFQHAKLSEFIWHPTYAIGNSLVDPRLGFDGLTGTSPSLADLEGGGWDRLAAGWSDDPERAEDDDEWARFARFMMKDFPEDENLVYDLSYESNHSLWDEFFLSSGSLSQRRAFVESGSPLPNGRMRLHRGGDLEALNDLERSASQLLLDGAFNINSTNREAWKALLSSTRQSGLASSGYTPFLRSRQALLGEFLGEQSDPEGDAAWAGYRSLSEEEIDRLAGAIVEQVQLRGPFLSLSDFVNRRLVNDLDGDRTGVSGPLQAAIDAAGLNVAFEQRWAISNQEELPDQAHPDNLADSTRLSQRLKPDSNAWGATGYVTQADLLQVIGPALSARSDTFLIRCYGEARDANGTVTAEAWCEAVVQRTPEPIVADETGLNPSETQPGGQFGRRFRVRSLRWLSKDEV